METSRFKVLDESFLLSETTFRHMLKGDQFMGEAKSKWDNVGERALESHECEAEY